MNMPTIRIQNIGPLADTGEVRVAPVTLVIGPQSSGKSTLMKLLCFCVWVEKHVMLDDTQFLYDYTHYDRFRRMLGKFHRLDSTFFSQESRLRYEGEAVVIELQGQRGNARITRKAGFTAARHNEKVCYLPAERNLISALQNVERAYRSNDVDELFNYIVEWNDARTSFTPERPLPMVFDANLHDYYERSRRRDMLLLADQGKRIPTFNASSGVQSAIPVTGMADYVERCVGQVAPYTLIDLLQREQSLLPRGPRRSAAAQPVADVRAEARRAVEELFRYRAFRLFVEEPEQNLFPRSQYELVRDLVRRVRRTNLDQEGPGSSLVLTTHSPYVLTVLNVLLLAAQAAKRDARATERVVPSEFQLPAADFAAYGITDDRRLETLTDPETGLVKGEWLDAVSDIVDEQTYRLNSILYGDEEGPADEAGA